MAAGLPNLHKRPILDPENNFSWDNLPAFAAEVHTWEEVCDFTECMSCAERAADEPVEKRAKNRCARTQR